MKRRILIGIDETPMTHESCRFGAVNCLKKASIRNTYKVPMCKNCYNIWDKLKDGKNGVEYTDGDKVQIPNSCLEFSPLFNKEVSPEDDDEPTDEFYCGDY